MTGGTRVLHVASGDLWAGAEVMLCGLAAAQHRRADTDVEVVLLNEGRLATELRTAGVRMTVLAETRMNLFGLTSGLRRIIRRFSPDIVHTHRIKEDLIGAVAAKTSMHGPRCVRTVHGADEVPRNSPRQRLAGAVHRLCVRTAFERSFAVSRPLARDLKLAFGPDAVGYVGNGIDLSRVGSMKPSNAKSGALHVGFAGRLVPIKRVDLFLRAAAILLSEDPSGYRFSIHGEGPEADNLRALADDLKISHAVTFAGFSNDIISRMQDMDVLFLTSDSEGFPMVVLEAMGMGLPVVVPAVGELPEVLDNGRCGTLVSTQSAEAYASAARGLRADPQRFDSMAMAAQQRVRELYSADASAAAYMHAYQAVLGHAPKGNPQPS